MSDRFEALADAISERVLDRLDEHLSEPEPLLDAEQLAELLRVRRDAIYRWAEAGLIPSIKLGDGERPRLRFDRAAVVEALSARSEPVGGRA